MHSALFKIHSGREMHSLKMVSVPFSVGLQAVPRCLGWCSIKMEHPSLKHKRRWLIIKVKILLSCLLCRTLIRCVNSYQAPSYLSSCACCAGIPHQLPWWSTGPPLGMWKHRSWWHLPSVDLQAQCGLRDMVHREEKFMAFEADKIYICFLYIAKFFICRHSQKEKLKAQIWNVSASDIHRDTFWWGEKRFILPG